jgi:hypothetical protein
MTLQCYDHRSFEIGYVGHPHQQAIYIEAAVTIGTVEGCFASAEEVKE